MSEPDSSRQRAISKLRAELAKDIERAIAIARECGLWELLRLCYLLRVNRIYLANPEYRKEPYSSALPALQLRDDALKYAISLLARHGSWSKTGQSLSSFRNFNNALVERLENVCRHINAKFDTEALLHVANVRVSGDRDQYCLLDLDGCESDPKRQMYFHYGVRLEHSTIEKKERLLSAEALIERLRLEFLDADDLFESEMGLSVESFCDGLQRLERAFVLRGQEAEAAAGVNKHGLINPDSLKTFVGFACAMVFTDQELSSLLGEEFVKYIKGNSFDGKAFNDAELRLHYLTRRPFLVGNGFAILSCDLVFDSVLTNIHFTLLEGAQSKAKHMERISNKFIDQIVAEAARGGYTEVARGLCLKLGKKDLGDVDLVLTNDKTGHSLLVEAKNHALPLAAYFKSPEAIDARIKNTEAWQEKVQRRIEHLLGSAHSRQFVGKWDYIIVSRMAEPLSHVSNVLVLSIDEFSHWVALDQKPTSFSDFHERFYKPDIPTMSAPELQNLLEAGFSLMHPYLA